MLLDLLLRVVINAIALILAVQFVPNVRAPSDILKLIVLAIIFGLVNAYLRPIVKALSLPLTIVTFGLIGIVINTAMVLLAAWLSGQLNIDFTLAGWPGAKFGLDAIIAAFLTSVVISVVSALMSLVRLAAPGR